MPFKVFVDDNFHYQDESERYEQGEYDTFEAAVAACKVIVDEYLESAYKKGMDASELNSSYVMFGEDPFVVPKLEGAEFSAREYARQRCNEICRAT
jgi:hypothetical protein